MNDTNERDGIISPISVPSFSDFVAEGHGDPDQVVRLCLSEQYDSQKYGAGRNRFTIPALRVMLDLQGFNDRGELVWLSQSLAIRWGSDGPTTPDGRDRYEGMSRLQQIVAQRLERLGYQVRPGRFVLPRDGQPLNGHFDCAEWYRDGEKRVRVRAVEK